MEQNIQIFGSRLFHKHKHLIDIDKVDFDRIALPNEDLYCKKGAFNCFISTDISGILLEILRILTFQFLIKNY